MRYLIAILLIITFAFFLKYAYQFYQETTRLEITPKIDILKELYNIKKELRKPFNEPIIEYQGKG